MNLLDISSWWQSLETFEKTFWVIALFFSLLFVVQTIMSFISGDADDTFGDSDMAVDSDDGIAHGFFTIKNFIAFFTIFGWTGIALIKGNAHPGIIITVSVLAGALVVGIMMFLFSTMSKLKESGTLQLENAIGLTAETYLFIPPKRTGYGKVHIKVQGSLQELPAITDDKEQIATGKLVKVLDIVSDSILLVTTKF